MNCFVRVQVLKTGDWPLDTSCQDVIEYSHLKGVRCDHLNAIRINSITNVCINIYLPDYEITNKNRWIRFTFNKNSD